MRSSQLLTLVIALAAHGCVSCSSGPDLYDATGFVENVDRDLGQVLISHQDIPGLMSAMTMNFDVSDGELLDHLEKGQVIEFRIAFDGRSYDVVEATVRGYGSRVGMRPPDRVVCVERG